MTKTALNVVGRGYRSIGYSHTCPSCYSGNTYFSCSESAWVCYNCGEVFPTPKVVSPPDLHEGKYWLHYTSTTPPTAQVEEGFADLRARLGR